ncbi:MAG TPA: cellulase family glycosylhydrolase [Opitutaceae bacterium]|nr:cellulase family glycosylhydrolase [Opitutaceae bacterium]
MRRLSRLLLLLAMAPAAIAAGPVEFRFALPPDPRAADPFAREIWARVATPSGRILELPAFYRGGGIFAVRARPDEAGVYRMGRVTEAAPGAPGEALAARALSPARVEVAPSGRTRLPAIGLDPRDRHGFRDSDGRVYFPVGANLAWPEGDCVPYYRRALAAFSAADLNWMRVWMVHWGGLNLDWLPPGAGPSPKPGGIDAAVAARWDELLEEAEARGVYLQVVFQHHGQYTTGANSNWAENPWNAANPGGFLKAPEDFFTDPRALRLTARKYRYIAARWGWSPAVFAWEFFNEVHWTDAWAHGHQAEVARWHDAMAALVRSVDPYRHLLTTSADDLRSAVYAHLDFYQPHLYAANLLAGVRSYDPPAAELGRPVFYGEFGGDHLPVAEAAKQAGLTLVPPAWAALMGEGMLAAQPWEGAKLLATGRAAELGAVHRFALASRLLDHPAARPFSAVAETAAHLPLQIRAGQIWQRRAAPELTVPVDGREPLGLADVPGVLVGSPDSLADGFPGRATYHFELPRPVALRVRVGAVGAAGSALRVRLDGRVVVDRTFAAGGRASLPASFSFPADAGGHTLVVENPGGPDWVEIPAIDLGLEIPVLAAVGRRDDAFLALWLWRRDGLYAAAEPAPVGGTLVLDRVPAGAWAVSWWDAGAGRLGPPATVDHPGGTLRLPIPPVARCAAVVLSRRP